jgi:hypothetical protein
MKNLLADKDIGTSQPSSLFADSAVKHKSIAQRWVRLDQPIANMRPLQNLANPMLPETTL